jgi:DNA-binding response OmpR family regulator
VAKFRLILVEDDDAIVRPLVGALERDGFAVDRFESAEEAVAAVPDTGPDLVIMDIGLPGMDGLEGCRVINQRWGIPVIVLTARGDPVDRILGLELGADDYMTKPFSSRELIARIRAVLRRGRRRSHSLIRIGELEVAPQVREVRVSGRLVALTRKEFDVLAYLADQSPGVVPRDELMTELWDAHWVGPTDTLDVHVAHLRRKIEADPSRSRYLHTVRGVGYQVKDTWPAD